MPPIEWSPSLEVHVKLIDDQHRDLVRLLNEVRAAVDSPDRHGEVTDLVGAIERKAIEHFHAEEQFMRESGHPFLEVHAQEHRMRAVQIAQYRGLLAQGKLEIGVVLEVIERWLLDHVSGMDSLIKHFARVSVGRAASGSSGEPG